jgi:hypothetical protein
MPSHKSHGRSYAEPPRYDELPSGVVDDKPQASTREERQADGRLIKGARTIPSMGGKASKGTTRLSHRIDDQLPGPWTRRARALRRATCAELARTVGGGYCGIGTSSLVKFFAVATAWADYYESLGDGDRAAKRREEARMHYVYAREQCAKDGKALREADEARKDRPNAFYAAAAAIRGLRSKDGES